MPRSSSRERARKTSSLGDQHELPSILTSLGKSHPREEPRGTHCCPSARNSKHVSGSICTILIMIFLYLSGIDQAAMQACTHRAPKEPSSVQDGNIPDLPFADSPGDLELSCLTLGLTTTSSSFLTDSTTRTEASLSPFATVLLLPSRPASSSWSDSEKIPEEKN